MSPNMETSCLNTAVSEWRFRWRPTPSLQASPIDLSGIKHIHIYIFHTINEIICLEMGRSLALAVNLQGSHWVFFLRLDKGRAAETYLEYQCATLFILLFFPSLLSPFFFFRRPALLFSVTLTICTLPVVTAVCFSITLYSLTLSDSHPALWTASPELHVQTVPGSSGSTSALRRLCDLRPLIYVTLGEELS